MSFVVSARKYRPKNFDELVGQDHIATTLKNAIKNDKLAHAFLFSGPRGVGKTTSARILAKVLNCENLSPEYHACETCSACKAFSDNASFNIFELDAASNNSVDHIRSLNDQVRFQPQQGSYKIYIIDEVHMLSQAAFNAFLKTLEEPPPYAKFILATTEKHKIIPTILSRCQIFDFRRIQIKDIVNQVQQIADKEQRTFDDEALHLIAQKADGAMRDALSIYDKMVSTLDGNISYKDVAANLNVLDHDYYFSIIDAAIKEDFTSLMLQFDEVVKNGFEVEQFISGLLAHLRQLLLVKDLQTAQLMETSENLKVRFQDQAALASDSFIMTALSLLDKTDMNLLRSHNKRLTMEIALSKIAYMNRVIEKKKITEVQPPKARPAVVANKKANSKSTAKVSIVKEAPAAASKKSKNELTTDDLSKRTRKYSSLTPTITTDIDALVASIDKEEKKKRAHKNPFTDEFIGGILQEWKKKSLLNSFKSAVTNSKVVVKDNKLTIFAPSEVFSELLKQESDMILDIRSHYPKKEIEIVFEVDSSVFPDYKPPEKVKILTTNEKIALFNQQNPTFEAFIHRLNLKAK